MADKEFAHARCRPPMNLRPYTIAVLLLAVVAGGLPVAAQQAPKIPKVGLFTPSTPVAAAPLVEAFKQGLRELGYIEGKTFLLEVRYGEAKRERLRELARDLVAVKVDVIVVSTDGAIAAVRRETGTIPIVMTNSSDPVGTGFVASLAHPGGNVTGISNISPELSGKRLELLRQVVPESSPAWHSSGIPRSGATCSTTRKRSAPPVPWVWSFNPLKSPAPRTSIAASQP